jgi:hypothetical protein
MELFSTFDVEKICKIKRTRLQEWLNKKNHFIVPSQCSGGRGKKALFSREDLYGIQLFIELLEMNLDRTEASEIINYVLGRPVRMQSQPVDWEKGFLNLCKLTPEKDPRGFPFNFVTSYGKQPGVTQYFQEEDTPGKVPFCTIIIRLKDIKDKVDRNIN